MRRSAFLTRRLFGLKIAAAMIGVPTLWTKPIFAMDTSAPDEGGELIAPPDYTLGVFPFLPALTLDRVFAPVIRELNTGMRVTFQLRTKPDFETFLKEVSVGGYDFIFVHPFLYVDAVNRVGYRPLVRVTAPMTAVIVTTATSSVQSIEDLRGKTLALPPRLSAVSAMLKSDLISVKLRIPSDTVIRHYLSKRSCIQALAIGKADACGLPRFLIPEITDKMAPELRVIHETKPLASLTFATHPRINEDVHLQLRDCLLQWQETEEAQQILRERGWHGLIEAWDRDFDVVREHRSRMTAFLGQDGSHAP